MANEWFRLWHDMPNDPKFKTIAKKSGQPLPLVICVFLHVLVNASANASERGRTKGLSIEDIATALDAEEERITSIMETMQGRLIDGDLVMKWEKRQPLREDGSAERAKAWRQAQKAAKQQQSNDIEREENNSERKRTQENEKERQDKDTEEDKEIKEKINKKEKTVFGVQELIDHGLSESMATELFQFRKRKKAAISPLVWKHFCKVAQELGLSLNDAAQEWVLLNSQGFEAEWVRNRKGQGTRASPQPVNKQEALEQRNAEVGRRWLAKQGIET